MTDAGPVYINGTPYGEHVPKREPFDDGYLDSIGRPRVPEARRFELIPFADIQFSDGPRWLIRGLLAATGLAIIFGPPKQYKSFVAADVGLHIASGRAWAGRRVRQGAVVYIVGEGQTGFSDRIAANRLERDYPSDLPFYLIKARPNLGTGEGDRAALIASIEAVVNPLGIPLAAIFMDTLVRALAGADENDEGMKTFTDNAEAISDHFGCCTVAVHHTGKDVTRGMRGSSALHGAVVTSWKVEKAQPLQARITLEDAKDGEVGLVWTADLEKYVFRQDEDGHPESVLLVREVSDPTPENMEKPEKSGKPVRSPPPSLKLFLACLDAALGADGRAVHPYPDGPQIKVVPLEKVREEYLRCRGDEASPDAKRNAFKYSQKIGIERKLVVIVDHGGEKVVWPTKAA